jgi:WD40 repeat protein
MATEIARDGRTLLTAGGKHHARLWDAMTGGAGPVFADPDEEMFFHAAFSPDGKSVLTMNNEGAVRLWDVASGEVRSTWTGSDEGVCAGVRFSPAGRHIVAQFDDLHLIDLASGDVVAKLPFMADENCLAFSPNGKFLAAGSDEAVMVWEV